MPTNTKIKVSKEDFLAYEDVRVSGVTNMFMVNTVEGLSGLDREQIVDIMKNYTSYAKKWLPKRYKQLQGK